MYSREKRIYRVTVLGSVVNVLLVALKFAFGIVGRSSAMIADAVHSLSDLVTDVVVIVFVRLSRRTLTTTTGTASMRLWQRPS